MKVVLEAASLRRALEIAAKLPWRPEGHRKVKKQKASGGFVDETRWPTFVRLVPAKAGVFVESVVPTWGAVRALAVGTVWGDADPVVVASDVLRDFLLKRESVTIERTTKTTFTSGASSMTAMDAPTPMPSWPAVAEGDGAWAPASAIAAALTLLPFVGDESRPHLSCIHISGSPLLAEATNGMSAIRRPLGDVSDFPPHVVPKGMVRALAAALPDTGTVFVQNAGTRTRYRTDVMEVIVDNTDIDFVDMDGPFSSAKTQGWRIARPPLGQILDRAAAIDTDTLFLRPGDDSFVVTAENVDVGAYEEEVEAVGSEADGDVVDVPLTTASLRILLSVMSVDALCGGGPADAVSAFADGVHALIMPAAPK